MSPSFNLRTFAQDDRCECDEVFDEMIVKLEANYIGLKHFEAQGKGQEYEERKGAFTEKAKRVEGANCAEFLQEFLNYFEDGHLYVIERPVYEGEELDSIHDKIERERRSIEELEQILSAQKRKGDDAVIGTYRDQNADFILIKEDDAYKVYIKESKNGKVKPGEIKATFKSTKEGFRGTFYSYDHIPRFMKGGLYKDGTLLRVEGSIWIKTDTDQDRELSMVNFEGTDWPTVQKLDEDNVLMSIPRFSVDIEVWRRVTKENRDLLLNAKNLIFDIRGNRGGNAIYFSLFNLFADQEMPGGQGHVLASKDMLAYFERNLQYSKKIYGPVVEAIKKNMGEIVDGPLYPKRKYKRRITSKVENVAILTDEACMSAAESFIIHCKQNSTLVKTFGSPTDGVIDYTSVGSVLLNSSRNQKIIFGYPTSTLHKEIPNNGYNKTGIVPDVPIADKVKDKVAYIMDYYKQDK